MEVQLAAMKKLEIVKRVLVVDDYEEIRQLLTFALEPEGYHVATVAERIAAIEFLTCVKDPWIVLLDIMMPQLSGLEVCTRLHAAGPAVAHHRVALMTASALELNDCPPPVRTLLRKPFTMSAVLHVVAMLEH